MRQLTKIAAFVASATLVLAGCAQPEPESGGGGGDGGQGAGSDVRVGLAYDVGGRGDQSFNDAAARGLDRATEEFGLQSEELEAADGEAESAREDRLIQLADAGYNPIIAVGFAYSSSVAKVAPQYPEVSFAIVDDAEAKGDNIANLLFAEEEGSFLVGAAAALKTKTDHIGFVGGVEVPLIQKFEAGYIAGAKEVNPNIRVDVTYLTQPPEFSGFADPAKGRTAATGMFDAGADIVYHAAGGSGSGVFEAAKAGNGWAIGVDSDQYKTASPGLRDVILTSMIKKVDVAVFDYLEAFVNGQPLTGEQVYNLEDNGVAYSTSGGFIDDITDQLDEYKQQIMAGDIKVPSTP
ncbi:MAG TPA: BMP family ABC transporter substrate-binding protein [Nocardioidaceae bacterium]|nr:BMP family ABC transporter substrate-binding protein [Nocardioidaceae bacterium]